MAQLAWLGIARHGESTGNRVAAAAERDGREDIPLTERDADVPLSEKGQAQAAALRTPIGVLQPDLVVVSPYLRARQTAALALAGYAVPVGVDERLRDRELGVLDRLTRRGVAVRWPAESARRAALGKFYYRPPGGESWADVLLRLRTVLRELASDQPDGRVLLVAHEATVLLVRYLVEGLDEATLMAVARTESIMNASWSSWRRRGDRLSPEVFNDVTHLRATGAPVTTQEEVHGDSDYSAAAAGVAAAEPGR